MKNIFNRMGRWCLNIFRWTGAIFVNVARVQDKITGLSDAADEGSRKAKWHTGEQLVAIRGGRGLSYEQRLALYSFVWPVIVGV